MASEDISSDGISSDGISTVRSFSRTVTQRVGSLTDRFLGRDRPLAEARLLFEIGSAGQDVRQLRASLGLDSGYLSRLLRSLERQGLVSMASDDKDRRVRRALLTELGEEELAELNRGGDALAESILEPLDGEDRQRLVQAMAQVERLLRCASVQIDLEDPDSSDGRWCLQQYFEELDRRFEGGFDVRRSLSADPEETRPPRGAFLLARLDGQLVGCGALKCLEPGVASVKRMWIAPEHRGAGFGRRMLRALETQARDLGVALLRLETSRDLAGADMFYRRHGYRDVTPFNDDPYAHFWFEKRISP